MIGKRNKTFDIPYNCFECASPPTTVELFFLPWHTYTERGKEAYMKVWDADEAHNKRYFCASAQRPTIRPNRADEWTKHTKHITNQMSNTQEIHRSMHTNTRTETPLLTHEMAKLTKPTKRKWRRRQRRGEKAAATKSIAFFLLLSLCFVLSAFFRHCCCCRVYIGAFSLRSIRLFVFFWLLFHIISSFLLLLRICHRVLGCSVFLWYFPVHCTLVQKQGQQQQWLRHTRRL